MKYVDMVILDISKKETPYILVDVFLVQDSKLKNKVPKGTLQTETKI